jgi:hypothetical protein
MNKWRAGSEAVSKPSFTPYNTCKIAMFTHVHVFKWNVYGTEIGAVALMLYAYTELRILLLQLFQNKTRLFTYNVTLRRVRVPIVSVEKQ